MTLAIRAGDLRQTEALARLHAAQLTGVLARLGLRALTAFYRGALASSQSVIEVATDRGEVKGFVLGSLDPAGLRRDVLASNRWEVASSVCLGCIRHPSIAASLVRNALRHAPAIYDPASPELTYLAVNPEARRAGLGRKLVEVFEQSLRRRGAAGYELSVDANNAAAIAFYDRLGFERVGQYREFGTHHLRYRRQLS